VCVKKVFPFHMISVALLMFLISGCMGGAMEEVIVTEAPAAEEPEEGPLNTATAPAAVLATPEPTESISLIQPAILEARRLFLEWPPTIRVNDSDTVRLTLEADAEGNVVVTVEVEGHETREETVFIPDVYDTHNVFAEARLDMAGIEITPNETFSQSLLPGKSITFRWSVSPKEIGTYRGTVWLLLRFLPLDGGPESRIALTAQLIEIKAVNLLGLSGNAARIMGAAGVFLSTLLGLDDILSFLAKILSRFVK
jgi:hypothetical protein